jgi:hypothetical protein
VFVPEVLPYLKYAVSYIRLHGGNSIRTELKHQELSRHILLSDEGDDCRRYVGTMAGCCYGGGRWELKAVAGTTRIWGPPHVQVPLQPRTR